MRNKLPIGSLNGGWAWWFKLNQLLIPILLGVIITWTTWTTRQIYSLQEQVNLNKSYVLERGEFRNLQFATLDKIITRIEIDNNQAHDKILQHLDVVHKLLTDHLLEKTRSTADGHKPAEYSGNANRRGTEPVQAVGVNPSQILPSVQ